MPLQNRKRINDTTTLNIIEVSQLTLLSIAFRSSAAHCSGKCPCHESAAGYRTVRRVREIELPAIGLAVKAQFAEYGRGVGSDSRSDLIQKSL